MAIFVEHMIIAFKIVVALVIPDVPREVINNEFRRETIEQSSYKEMMDYKYKGGHETFDDMT